MKSRPAVPFVPLPAAECAVRAQGHAPALRRRLAAFLYEGVLLFGVVMVVGLIFGVIVGQRHALQHRQGLQATVFVVLSMYFMWFWTHGGQTLAMKTWQLRIVSIDGAGLSLQQALMRYFSSWLWFAPALVGAWLVGWHQSKWLYGALFGWMAIYALLSWLHPQRQFLHDALCKTRLIDTRP
ncbi:RDD family protein [Aquabacterium sp.]|uniref:RDD family protein n=1 Tax=Aquabacterium sp. TaxID=1872578 RepID=UPI0019917DD1|nr:RDD family protein [Aquabacterium sp.]MBC7698798.1 RDD family protein [Aquabacterium sp.]